MTMAISESKVFQPTSFCNATALLSQALPSGKAE